MSWYDWEKLIFMKEFVSAHPPKTAEAWVALSEEMKRLKRKIRSENRQRNLPGEIIADYGIDGFVERIDLPEAAGAEEARDYYYKNMHIEGGFTFSAWHKIVKRGSGYAIYHRVCRDV